MGFLGFHFSEFIINIQKLLFYIYFVTWNFIILFVSVLKLFHAVFRFLHAQHDVISSHTDFDVLHRFDALYSFSSLIVLANTANTILSKTDGSGHPCLISVLRGSALSFFPFSVILALDCNMYFLWFLEAFLLYQLWRVLLSLALFLFMITCFLSMFR